MYVIGGQNFVVIPNPSPEGPPFLSVSDFFNDVWRSRDGLNWEQMTDDAGWDGRAGLSAVSFKGKLWVMGGSVNDDSAVIGGPPVREYFNDVWVSENGKRWSQVTESAPWAPRAGAIVVVKNGYMWLIGGEDGFTCDSGGDRCPPYVTRSW
jgi:N-acetylneuraminic acid mutarotase